MANQENNKRKKVITRVLGWLVPIAIVVAGCWTYPRWKHRLDGFWEMVQNRADTGEDEHAHDHDAGSANPDSLHLSPQAWNNIGLVTGVVEPRDFVKTVTVPAIVAERPGRSQVEITAPMTGIVTRIHLLERQEVRVGEPLVDMRLTHEDVVTAQTDFLNKLQALDVVDRELNRLKNISQGVIPGKRIIEQQYRKDEIVASLAALRQSLLLHGMSEEQILNIEQTRTVIGSITVYAPPYPDGDESGTEYEIGAHGGIAFRYHVQKIAVKQGESVQAGNLVMVLADHCLLYVEGRAFEGDADRLVDAFRKGTPIEVRPVDTNASDQEVLQLKLESISDQVDATSRALKFYLLLPNRLLHAAGASRSDFIAWKYRPGQRMEARIPTTDVWRNKIVLPPDAVVIDGPNAFVFEQNGDNFDRIDVQVLHRDKDTVVLENDGQLIGSVIAMNGAYEMHLALKNQSGGAIDPHAGHNH